MEKVTKAGWQSSYHSEIEDCGQCTYFILAGAPTAFVTFLGHISCNENHVAIFT